MSLINDKKSIVNQLGVLNSIGQRAELPKTTDTFPSVNNKNEPLPFLLDLITQLKGSMAVRASVGTLLTSFVVKIEPTLKASLKKQLIPFNANTPLPVAFGNTGYNLPVKTIDAQKKLKVNPNTDVGSLLYPQTNSFDKVAHGAIGAAGTDVTFNSITMKYNSGIDTMTIKPVNPSQNIGTFVNGYIDSMTIIDKKEFNTRIMDEIFGTATKQQNKSLEDIVEDEKVSVLFDKLLSGDALEFTDKEIQDIQNKAKNKLDGVDLLDLGCGYFVTNLTIGRVAQLVSSVTGTTSPETVVNQYDSVLNDSTNNQILGKDEITAKDNFFRRIIKAIQKFILQAITMSSQIMTLKYLVSGFKNNNTITPVNILIDIKNNQSMADCLSGDVKSEINKYFFGLAKAEIIKLTTRVGKSILNEKIQGYINILKSLTF